MFFVIRTQHALCSIGDSLA